MMELRARLRPGASLLIGLMALVGACGGGGGGSDGVDVGSDPGGGRDPASCRTTFTEYTTLREATVARNGPEACDYFIDDTLQLDAPMRVEPGTVIRFGPEGKIRVATGSLDAIGTADARIRFEGASASPGFWFGIRTGQTTARLNLAYADVLDAGKIDPMRNDYGGVVADLGVASLANVRVSNSGSHGMVVGSSVTLERFSANTMSGNLDRGLLVAPRWVHVLDASSVYAGTQDAPNQQTGILVAQGEISDNLAEHVWKKLDTDYVVRNVEVSASTLKIEPGVQLRFDTALGLTFSRQGRLLALGTEAEPITMRGMADVPGNWEGVTIRTAAAVRHQIAFTSLLHAGAASSGFLQGAIRLFSGADLQLDNASIGQSLGWGIDCTDGVTLRRGANVVFGANQSGEIAAACNVLASAAGSR